MCHEKNRENDSEAFKIASIYRYQKNRKVNEKYTGRLVTAIRNNTDNTRINRTKITRKYKLEEKQLYGHFK